MLEVMKKLIILWAICLGSVNQLHGKKVYNWSIPKGEMTHVFEITTKKDQSEILRLYSSGEYEYISYLNQKRKSEIVKRNLGTFTMKGSKIIFNNPSFKEFQGGLKYGVYFLNGDLYDSKLDCLFKRENSKIKKQTQKQFKKPFYIGFKTDEIVSNNQIDKAFELKDLVNYLVQDVKTDRDKVLSIARFITRSIEYDYEGLRKNNYAHFQSDIYGIISSSNRVAVCAGYAYVFDSLARIAGVKSREVTGYTKSDYYHYNILTGLHAWNIVNLDGEEHYVDVTWSDLKKDLEMKWMFIDPELMLLSHFPLNKEDVLTKDNFTTNDFKKREVVLPLKNSVKVQHYPISGYCAINSDVLKLKFSQKVDVYVDLYDFNLGRFRYSVEESYVKNNSPLSNEIIDVKSYFSKDTFYVEIPISKKENVLEIKVGNDYIIKTIVYKGSETNYFKELISKWDDKHAIAFSSGILAAIKIGDKKFLKEKLGDKYTSMYDKKGKWKLSKLLLTNIMKWDGSSYGLINEVIYETNNKLPRTEQVVKFNDNDKLMVKFQNNKYEFLSFK